MVWATLAVLAASVVISALLAPRIPDQQAARLSDFGLPTADSARAVSVVFGTVLVQGPNIVWAGDFEADPIRQTTGLKIRGLKISKRRATVGYRYFAGIHFVVSHTVEKLLAIFVDDDILTVTDLDDNASFNIDEPNRFGGREGSGGLRGTFDVMFGAPDQGANDYLTSQVNFVPGYRGLLSVVLNRFYLGNSPMFPPWSFLVQRVNTNLQGESIWYPEKAGIFSQEGTDGLQEFINGTDEDGNPNPPSVATPEVIDLNPAHIIYSVLTELIGIPASRIDDTLFRAAADTLYDEQFGLSYVWDDASSYDDFIRRVVDHIDATLHVDPVTSLWGLYLIRTIADEDIDIVFDESNSTLDEFNREGYGELYSEIDIKSVDRFTGNEIGIRETNDALVRIQGGPNGTEQTFDMAFDLHVRRIIASRNRLFNSIPKCHGTLEADHSRCYNRFVGEPIFISSRKYGFELLKARITQVRFRNFNTMRGQIEWIQDYREADSTVPFTSADNREQEIEIADPGALFNARPLDFSPVQMHWGFLDEADLRVPRFQSRLIFVDDDSGAPHVGFHAYADDVERISDAGFSREYEPVSPSPRGDSWIDDNHFDASNIPLEELVLEESIVVSMVLLPPMGGANQIHRSEVVIIADLSNYPIIGVRRGALGSRVIIKRDPLDTYGPTDGQQFLINSYWLPEDVAYDRQSGAQEVFVTPFTQAQALPIAQAQPVIEYLSMPVSWYLPPASLKINGERWPIFSDLNNAEINYVVFDPYDDIDATVSDDAQGAGIAPPFRSILTVREFIGNAILYSEDFTGGNMATVDGAALWQSVLDNSILSDPQEADALIGGYAAAGLSGGGRLPDTRFVITLQLVDDADATKSSELREHVVRGAGGWGFGWGTPEARKFRTLAPPGTTAPQAGTIPTRFDYTLPTRADTVELGPLSFSNPAGYVTYGFESIEPMTDDGAYYVEYQHAGTRNDNGSVGFQQIGVSLNSWLGSASTGVGIYDDGQVFIAAANPETVPFTLGARVGAALIIDGAERRVQYYMDGVAVGPEILITNDPDAVFVPAATSRNGEIVSLFVAGEVAHAPAGTTPWPQYQDDPPPAPPTPPGGAPTITSNERFIY